MTEGKEREPHLEEELCFIQEHAKEIVPITDDRETMGLVERHTGVGDVLVDERRVKNILEQFETKVYLLEKDEQEYDSRAKRVLLTASEPLAYNTIAPILESLKSDRRARAITLLTDNVAGKRFEERGNLDFRRIRDHTKPVLADVPSPFDVAIAAVEPPNSAHAVALYGGKSVFGAEKLYFIASGWSGVGGTKLFERERARTMDEIDGMFCNDELAKRILLRQLPDYPTERMHTTGTPSVDALELERASEYTREGRRKLRLDEETLAVLHLGDISADYRRLMPEVDERINEKTFEHTVEAMVRLAEDQPERKFALLIRPHPRDPNKEELLAMGERQLPGNLRVIPATGPEISMQEAAYAADVVVSIISTENFLATVRGRKAVFLGYEGLGDAPLERTYGQELLAVMNAAPSLRTVSSPRELASYLKACPRASEVPVPLTSHGKSAAEKILDIALA